MVYLDLVAQHCCSSTSCCWPSVLCLQQLVQFAKGFAIERFHCILLILVKVLMCECFFRRYPVIWQGHLTLKNDLTAVQLHFLGGNAELAKMSLPPGNDKLTPTLHIAQRMRLEKSQLDGVERRIQVNITRILW